MGLEIEMTGYYKGKSSKVTFEMPYNGRYYPSMPELEELGSPSLCVSTNVTPKQANFLVQKDDDSLGSVLSAQGCHWHQYKSAGHEVQGHFFLSHCSIHYGVGCDLREAEDCLLYTRHNGHFPTVTIPTDGNENLVLCIHRIKAKTQFYAPPRKRKSTMVVWERCDKDFLTDVVSPAWPIPDAIGFKSNFSEIIVKAQNGDVMLFGVDSDIIGVYDAVLDAMNAAEERRSKANG